MADKELVRERANKFVLEQPDVYDPDYYVGFRAGFDFAWNAQVAYLVALEALLKEFMYVCDGDEACRLDHHGFCQTHASGPPCYIAEARALLEKTP